jgi:hypothetical protein
MILVELLFCFHTQGIGKKGHEEPEWGPDGQIGIFSSSSTDAAVFETNFGLADEANYFKQHFDKPDPLASKRALAQYLGGKYLKDYGRFANRVHRPSR